MTRLGADGEGCPAPPFSPPATPRGGYVRLRQGVNPLVTGALTLSSESGGEADIQHDAFLARDGGKKEGKARSRCFIKLRILSLFDSGVGGVCVPRAVGGRGKGGRCVPAARREEAGASLFRCVACAWHSVFIFIFGFRVFLDSGSGGFSVLCFCYTKFIIGLLLQ